VEGLTQEERSRLIRSVGTHRGVRPLSPVEVGELLARALQHSPASQVAEEVDFKGTTMVSRFVRLLELPQEFQPLVDWGQSPGGIPFTAASVVEGLPHETQTSLLNQLISGEISVQDLRQVVPIIRKGRPVEEAIREAGKLRPIVVRRHLLIGGVSREDQERVRALDQDRREAVILAAVSGLISPGDLTAARLLPDRFTIVTNDSGKASIDQKAAAAGVTFERLVQSRIRNELGKDAT
jgi:hypothetical protein